MGALLFDTNMPQAPCLLQVAGPALRPKEGI